MRLTDQVREEQAAGKLLPTPTASDGNGAGLHGDGGADLRTTVATLHATDFGDYAPAVERWEQVLGRPAPPVSQPSPLTGKEQLSARFVEWMMGLPDGHVTDVEGISRTKQLRLLGNGVVPQQAHLALQSMSSPHVRSRLVQDTA